MKTLNEISADTHPFLLHLSPEHCSLLESCSTVEHFRTNESIFRKGADADHFYLIQSGRVDLETPFVPGEGVVTVQSIGAGELLGWSWLYPPYKWHFTARAAEPVTAIRYKASTLREMAEFNPAFGYQLALRIGGVMLERLQATRQRLLGICEINA